MANCAAGSPRSANFRRLDNSPGSGMVVARESGFAGTAALAALETCKDRFHRRKVPLQGLTTQMANIKVAATALRRTLLEVEVNFSGASLSEVSSVGCCTLATDAFRALPISAETRAARFKASRTAS